jgi:3-phosphoshikimate 1-carboxyvinyltransferase
MTQPPASATRFAPSGPLRGSVRVPGDKSISHRALMLSALAVGESRITGLLEGEDVLATAAAMRAMGAVILPPDGGGSPSPSASASGDRADQRGTWTVHGVGVGGLLQPAAALDMGNSGTSTRLLMGLVASHAVTATFIGDASLSKRPMGRVIDPLSSMGADISASPGGRLPLMVRGIVPAVPMAYTLPVASAQVKSAILLAGLNTPGVTEVIEPVPTRDHSERMLAGFGAELTVEEVAGVRHIRLRGEAELTPQTIEVPGDPSSAAFPIVAALVTPGSEVTVTNVGMNPTRTGIYRMLEAMGADLSYSNERIVGGEPVADVTARHSALTAIEVPPEVVPSMVDEFPIFFVAAAMASGVTRASGLEELRVKESDRLALMAGGLMALGIHIDEGESSVAITGTGGEPLPGSPAHPPLIHAELDHRIAMSFAVAGLNTRGGLSIDDMSPVATSFPGFEAMLRGLAG